MPNKSKESDSPEGMLSGATRIIGNLTKRIYRHAGSLLPNRRYASTTYRFLAKQLAEDLAGLETTPKIVFSTTGDLETSSEILLMLAYYVQDELSCNVLIVDGTFRRGGVSDRLGLNNPIGFVDYLCGEHWTPNPLIASTANSNIFVMPGGSTPNLKREPLDRDVVEAKLGELTKGFSFVFIQQDSIARDTRYLVFNQLADMVLLHAIERETRMHELESCRKIYHDHLIGNVRLVLSENE